MKKVVKKIVFGAFLLITTMIFVSCDSEKLDCESLYQVEFTGVSGKGVVEVSFNSELLENKTFLDKIFPDDSKNKASKQLKEIADSLTVEIDKESELSNGDNVKISIDVADEELLEDYSIKLTNTEFVVKVEGLTDVEQIDPFENIELEFYRNSPFLKVNVKTFNSTEFVAQHVSFSTDKDIYKNGDILTITASISDYDSEKYGKVLSTTTKTFNVENQKAYISSIDDGDMTELHNIIERFLLKNTDLKDDSSYFFDTYIGKDKFKSVKSSKLHSSHILNLTDVNSYTSFSTDYNKYIQIYDYLLEQNGEDDIHVFVVMNVHNVIVDSKGTISWSDMVPKHINSFTSYKQALDECVNNQDDVYTITDVVTPNLEQ